MNFLSIARKVTMNSNNVNTEARRSLKKLHTKLDLQREKWLLELIACMEYVIKYTEFLN